MNFVLFWIICIAALVIAYRLNQWLFNLKRKRRREYYREYLKSDAKKRKRYVVLKRDNWTCQYCGDNATEVHHKKYAIAMILTAFWHNHTLNKVKNYPLNKYLIILITFSYFNGLKHTK